MSGSCLDYGFDGDRGPSRVGGEGFVRSCPIIRLCATSVMVMATPPIILHRHVSQQGCRQSGVLLFVPRSVLPDSLDWRVCYHWKHVRLLTWVGKELDRAGLYKAGVKVQPILAFQS
jgi:hypothetical protein